MNTIVKNAFNNRSKVKMDQAYLTHMSIGAVLNAKSSKKDPLCKFQKSDQKKNMAKTHGLGAQKFLSIQERTYISRQICERKIILKLIEQINDDLNKMVNHCHICKHYQPGEYNTRTEFVFYGNT